MNLKISLLFVLLVPLGFGQQIFKDVATTDPYYAATRRLFFRGALDGAGGNFNAGNGADAAWFMDVLSRAVTSAASGNPQTGQVSANVCVPNYTNWTVVDQSGYFPTQVTRVAAAAVIVEAYADAHGLRGNPNDGIGWQSNYNLTGGVCGRVDPILQDLSIHQTGGSLSGLPPGTGYWVDPWPPLRFQDFDLGTDNGAMLVLSATDLIDELYQLVPVGVGCDPDGWGRPRFCPDRQILRGDAAVWIDAVFLSGTLPTMANPVRLLQETMTATNITQYEDPGEYMPELVSGSRVIRVPMHNGGYFEVPRLDLMTPIGNFQYEYSRDGGAWKYTYRLDPSVLEFFRVGDRDRDYGVIENVAPAGWKWFLHDFRKQGGASGYTNFSITSGWAPGLTRLYFRPPYSIDMNQSRKGPRLTKPTSEWERLDQNRGIGIDQIKIARAENWFINSRKELSIGPAFAPGFTQEEVKEKISWWVSAYGFRFLAPLVGAQNPRSILVALKPETQLEKDVVSALLEVLQ